MAVVILGLTPQMNSDVQALDKLLQWPHEASHEWNRVREALIASRQEPTAAEWRQAILHSYITPAGWNSEDVEIIHYRARELAAKRGERR